MLEIILRFRKHPVGVLADIEGMFMQVAIREDDQSALRFLWLEDGIIRQYQYARLNFGANVLALLRHLRSTPLRCRPLRPLSRRL